MKKLVNLFLLVLCWAVVSISPLSASVSFLDAGLSEVQELAAKEGKLYFVHFSAEWCMPCQWMEKNTFTDKKLSTYISENYLAAKLDVDKIDGQWYQNQYEVEMLPTILIFSSQGILLDRVETSLGAEDLLSILKTFNKPAHKISTKAPLIQAPKVKILDSPKAIFVFSRPALIPEKTINNQLLINTPAPKEAKLINNSPVFATVVHNQPAFSKRRTNAFTPRSVKQYYIETGVFFTYEDALKAVKQLEQKFDQPANFHSKMENGKMVYRVVVGRFKSRAKANTFFNYLRRNDIDGVLMSK